MKDLNKNMENKIFACISYTKSKISNLTFPDFSLIVYLSDKYHLQNYGRSIYKEEYIVIKGEPFALNSVKFFNKHNQIDNLDYLSESDIEALDYAIENRFCLREFDADTSKNKDYDVINEIDIAGCILNNVALLSYLAGN